MDLKNSTRASEVPYKQARVHTHCSSIESIDFDNHGSQPPFMFINKVSDEARYGGGDGRESRDHTCM
jgi:hypothetical protein